MIWRLPEPRFDVASAVDCGSRDIQEDAIISDFAIGDDCGIIVLADGMGGHAAGDVASKTVVTEVYSELKFHSDCFFNHPDKLPQLMSNAINGANDCIRETIEERAETEGMGATLVAAVVVGTKLYWSSVGDSPLFHYRAGEMKQVNEDHSLAPQIDAMVATGSLSKADAMSHPDRNTLVSAVVGSDIPRIDNSGVALDLKAGDIIVAATDGLQYLDDASIVKVITRNKRKSSAEIANALLQAVKALEAPDQDNVSFAVVKLCHEKPVTRPGNAKSTALHAMQNGAVAHSKDDGKAPQGHHLHSV